jgi:hypothetical protein
MAHLCSSTPEVQESLREGFRYMFTRVPELAGVMLITASEFPSHCYTGIQRPDDPTERQKLLDEGRLCPRCVAYSPQEVVGKIVTDIRDGVKSAQPAAEVIAWNWAWAHFEEKPFAGFLTRLPEDVIVLGNFERGQPTEACGFAYENREYSIKVVGPSVEFTSVADFQSARGLPIYAKIQIGTTHENPSIPYLPALPKIAEKYQALRDHGVTGMMTCWNFGNMPCVATEVAGEFTWDPQPPTIAQGLWRVAARNFGAAAANDVVAGWQKLSWAHDDFPSSIPVMYYGPVSRGSVLPFVFDRINHKFPHSWLLDREIAGDLLDWVDPFPPEKVLECFRSEVSKGAEGLALLECALEQTEGRDRERLQREIGVARFHLLQVASGANIVDFLLTRDAMYEAADPRERLLLLDRIADICRDEIPLSRAAIPLLQADSRLGWHGEAYGYMITPALIEAKLVGLKDIVNRRVPEMKRELG